jgi:molybdenum cofactor cytidylyltransferase
LSACEETLSFGLVLAAGFSSRAGAFKPALPLAGRAVLHRVLDALVPVVNGIVIVSGHEAVRVQSLVHEWFLERGRHSTLLRFLKVKHNPDYAEDMWLSVLVGAREVPPDSLLYILPADYPLITAEILRNLRSVYTADSPGERTDAYIPRHKGKNGHPVLLAPECLSRLQSLASPVTRGLTLKSFLAGQKIAYIEEEDPGILEDLDTPEDLARIEKILRERGGL